MKVNWGPKWRPPKVGGPVRLNTSNVPKAGPEHILYLHALTDSTKNSMLYMHQHSLQRCCV